MTKPIKAWGGFSNGKIDREHEVHTNNEVMAIFKRKRTASLMYEDVRRVTITIDNPPRKSARRGRGK